MFPLPEFGSGSPFPGTRAISSHLIGYAVHSWDIAKALEVEIEFPPDLLDIALAVAKAVPDGKSRHAPGAAFAPSLTWPGGPGLGGSSQSWAAHRAGQVKSTERSTL
ncbi:hypothetical protein [Streptosporangium roseum]|uniref:hypothetical protein n=1 Tax=Streptosporangium roseum TaxID=2001 RepID=UPI00332EE755